MGCFQAERVTGERMQRESDEARTYPAGDERIRVMGRHVVDRTGAIRFGASGGTFFMRFRGPRLDVELEDEFRDSTSYNWFTVVVDGGTVSRFRTRPGQQRYTLATDLGPGPHSLALSKATEGQNGHNRLVFVRAEALLVPAPLPERKIEFIGNSITSGYGADARNVACGAGTHAWLAYGPRLARRLNAQWMLSSVSGMGMHRNWNAPGPTMPDVYGGVYMEYTDAVVPWDFGRYRPDLVVIALGTNDFSEGDGEEPRPALDGTAFVRDYTRFVRTVRKKYPEAQLLLLDSPVLESEERKRLVSYLQQVVENRKAAGDSALATFTFDGQYTAGCEGHPDRHEQAQMADALEPVVRELMDW